MHIASPPRERSKETEDLKDKKMKRGSLEINSDEIIGRVKNKKKKEMMISMEVGMLQQQQQHLPNDMLSEIVARLPVKSLRRWKCVSKYWCSVISSPSFFQAFLSRHRGGLLLISTTPTEEESSTDEGEVKVQLCFYYSSLMVHEPEPVFCRFKVPPSPDNSNSYMGVTEVVNGLVCFYHTPKKQCNRLFVCNVCTGEIMRLPDPPTGDNYHKNNSYYLGYDSVNRLYKLLKLNTTWTGRTAAAAARYRQAVALFDEHAPDAFPFLQNNQREAARAGPSFRRVGARADPTYRRVALLTGPQREAAAAAGAWQVEADAGRDAEAALAADYYWKVAVSSLQEALGGDGNQLECEILTLGRDSSWRKLAVDFGVERLFVKFDANSLSINGKMYWVNQLLGERAGLISFDINQEKFQLVKFPMVVLSLVRQSPKLKLVQFRGCVALSSMVADPECLLVLHVLEENEGNLWSRHVIPFPPGFGGFASIATIPVGNLPTGELLLANPRAKVLSSAKDDSSTSFIPLYAYDPQRKKFERFIVGKLPDSLDLTDFRVTASCLAENIAPLGDLF